MKIDKIKAFESTDAYNTITRSDDDDSNMSRSNVSINNIIWLGKSIKRKQGSLHHSSVILL